MTNVLRRPSSRGSFQRCASRSNPHLRVFPASPSWPRNDSDGSHGLGGLRAHVDVLVTDTVRDRAVALRVPGISASAVRTLCAGRDAGLEA